MGETMVLDLPKDILDSAKLTVPELKKELAVHLYSQGRLSVGKARELAGLSLFAFRNLLASRNICVHLDEDDLAEDLANLKELFPK